MPKKDTKAIKKELNEYVKNWNKELSAKDLALERICKDFAEEKYQNGVIDNVLKETLRLKNIYLGNIEEVTNNEPDLCQELFGGRHYKELNIIDKFFNNINEVKKSPANRYWYLEKNYCLYVKRKLYTYMKELIELRKEVKELRFENLELKDQVSPIKLRSENMLLQDKIDELEKEIKNGKNRKKDI